MITNIIHLTNVSIKGSTYPTANSAGQLELPVG